MWGAIIQGAAALGSSLISGFSQNATSKSALAKQFENWQKSYDITRKDALSDYKQQLSDQRQLMVDEAALKKTGLEKAGINTANQVGNMSLGASPSADIRQGEGQMFDVPQTSAFSEFGQTLAKLADPLYLQQFKKMKADTAKVEADIEGKLTDNQQAKLNLDTYEQTQQALIATTKEQLEALRNNNALSRQQYDKIQVDIDTARANYDYLLKQIDRFEKFTPEEYKQLEETIRSLQANIRSTDAQTYGTQLDNKLKSMGILPNGSFFGNLLAMSAFGKVGDVVHSFVSGITDGISALISDAKDAYDKNKPTARNVVNTIKNDINETFHPAKRVIYVNPKNRKATVFWRRYIDGEWTWEKAKNQSYPRKYEIKVNEMRRRKSKGLFDKDYIEIK